MSDSEQIAKNQLRAKASWEKAFESIIYFAEPDARLASDKTKFIRTDDFPRIKLMVMTAAMYPDISCLINADIVVGEHLPVVATGLIYKGILALTSMRYEFEQDAPNFDRSAIADHGVDFFCATPQVWHKCWKMIPDEFRIGHGGWDSWMLGFLNWHCKLKFLDITPQRCIFHPRHGERKSRYTFSTPEPIFSHLSMFPSHA